MKLAWSSSVPTPRVSTLVQILGLELASHGELQASIEHQRWTPEEPGEEPYAAWEWSVVRIVATHLDGKVRELEEDIAGGVSYHSAARARAFVESIVEIELARPVMRLVNSEAHELEERIAYLEGMFIGGIEGLRELRGDSRFRCAFEGDELLEGLDDIIERFAGAIGEVAISSAPEQLS